MIKYRHDLWPLDDLVLGFDGEHVNFVWSPYENRSTEAQKGYDDLEADMRVRGMLHPLITYHGHVLIGMRRVEILRKIIAEGRLPPKPLVGSFIVDECRCARYTLLVPVVEILEDVSRWTADDVFERLPELKRHLYGTDAEAWVA